MKPIRFPEGLSIHPNAIREIDPISQHEHVWIPEKTDKGEVWGRLTIPKNVEQQEYGDLVTLQLRLREYIQDTRSRIKQFFNPLKSEKAWSPIGNNGENIQLHAVNEAREVLLVWAKQADIQLDEKVIMKAFPSVTILQKLSDAWLVSPVQKLSNNQLLQKESDVKNNDEIQIKGTLTYKSIGQKEKQNTNKFNMEYFFINHFKRGLDHFWKSSPLNAISTLGLLTDYLPQTERAEWLNSINSIDNLLAQSGDDTDRIGKISIYGVVNEINKWSIRHGIIISAVSKKEGDNVCFYIYIHID